jgi:hypothetical protein
MINRLNVTVTRDPKSKTNRFMASILEGKPVVMNVMEKSTERAMMN